MSNKIPLRLRAHFAILSSLMGGKDYYKILGVDRGASQDDIKKAFRKMAHKYHPDKSGGDEAKFKEVNEAYTTLRDEKKRAQYDQFGHTFSGAGGAGHGGFGGFGGAQNAQGFQGFDFSQYANQAGGQGGHVEFDLGDIFETFFGGGRRAPRGQNIQIDTEISFKDSVFGVKKEIKFKRRGEKDQETLSVQIPAGVNDGEMIRLRGKGEPHPEGEPGDLFIRIHVAENKNFTKVGQNLITNMTIKLSDALEGGKKEIETVDGKIDVKIPQGVEQGAILRVKGRGIQYAPYHRGDLLIKVKIETPKKLSRNAKKLIEELRREGL